jgi:quercetin dioxygenase-like cupin family protein
MKAAELKINFEDKRGKIIDLIENENINSVTYVSFTPGAIRGNHFHKETTQYNYVLKGKIRMLIQTGNASPVEAFLEKGDFVVCVPNERHAFQALEDSELMVFTRGPRGGKEYESDTFRLEVPLIPAAH